MNPRVALLVCGLVALLVPSGAWGSATITQVTPDAGPTAGGTPVTIFGPDLYGVRAVYFGSAPGRNLEEECGGHCEIDPYTLVSVESPPHPPGPVDIRLETADGMLSATEPSDMFAYTGPAIPVIESFAAAPFKKGKAQLAARIDPDGFAARYAFWVSYAPCQNGAGECALGTQTERIAAKKLAAGSSPVNVAKKAGKLRPGCSYTFWVIASSAQGEAESSHLTLTMPGLPGMACLR